MVKRRSMEEALKEMREGNYPDLLAMHLAKNRGKPVKKHYLPNLPI